MEAEQPQSVVSAVDSELVPWTWHPNWVQWR